MANNKDFLSQFSTNNKPDSYKEEERVPVEKPSKNISPKAIIIGIVALIIIAAIVFVIFFMPKIKVQNFEGLKKEDAVAWIKQQEIETSGIIFKDEYDFDNPTGTILSQDPNEGKVRKDAKMTFVVSKGPDPEERVSVPDLASMERDSIEAWIKQNKLLSTKINTTYSSDVEADGFIKADYSGCDESSFTRGCTLKISISKGPKPEDEITMQNFVKKTYVEFETWATSKKLKLNKTEEYSETVDAGVVISQSVRENEKVKSGDTINVVVSKGKGVKVADLGSMSKSEIDKWLSENAAYVSVTKKHFDSEDYIIEQSVKKGGYIDADNKLKITLNLGQYFYLDELGFTIVGNSYDKFKDNSYMWMDTLGVYIDTHKNWVPSDKPAGTILSIEKIFNDYAEYSEVQRLPLSIEITCNISTGNVTPKEEFYLPYYDFIDANLSELIKWRDLNPDYGLTIKIDDGEEKDPTFDMLDKKVESIKYGDKDILEVGGMIKYKSTIIVKLEAELETPGEDK